MTPSGRRQLWLAVLLVSLLVCLFCAAYPLYVIRPFRAQGTRELAAALRVLDVRGVLTAICALAAVTAAVFCWRGARTWTRAAAVAGALGACLFAALCHVNIYERMFHPDVRPTFSQAGSAKLAGGEMVLAIRVGDAARAYPIRSMSYHHIANDVLNGKPIAATY